MVFLHFIIKVWIGIEKCYTTSASPCLLIWNTKIIHLVSRSIRLAPMHSLVNAIQPVQLPVPPLFRSCFLIWVTKIIHCFTNLAPSPLMARGQKLFWKLNNSLLRSILFLFYKVDSCSLLLLENVIILVICV